MIIDNHTHIMGIVMWDREADRERESAPTMVRWIVSAAQIWRMNSKTGVAIELEGDEEFEVMDSKIVASRRT